VDELLEALVRTRAGEKEMKKEGKGEELKFVRLPKRVMAFTYRYCRTKT
jgi:hypothetical protein